VSLTRWLRKRMKLLLWIVAVVIAVVFGIPFTAAQVVGGCARTRTKAATLFGRGLTQEEWHWEAQLLRTASEIPGMRRVVAAGVEWPGKDSHYQVYAMLMMLEEAKRLGITASGTAIRNFLFEWYRPRRAYTIIRNRSRSPEEAMQQWWRYMMGAHPERAGIDAQIRSEFEKNPIHAIKNVGGLSYGTFEAVAERFVLAEGFMDKYPGIFTYLPPSAVYEEFRRRYHKRRFEVISLNSSDFRTEAEQSLTEEELTAFYHEVKDDYKQPRRVAFTCLLLPFAGFDKKVPEPDEKALEKVYRKWKLQPPIWDYETGAPRPLKEVKDYLVKRYRKKKAREMVEKHMKNLLPRINMKAMRPPKEMADFIKKEGLKEVKTVPAGEEEFLERNADLLGDEPGMAFAIWEQVNLRDEEDLRREFRGPVRYKDGMFVWRLDKVTERTVQPFEEVYDKVRERCIGEKSRELARSAAEEVGALIRAAGGVKDDLLLERQLALVETDFVERREPGGVKGLPDGFKILFSGWELERVGDVSKPVEAQRQEGWTYYVIRYAARQEADPERFAEVARRVEQDMREERREKTVEAWWDDLKRRSGLVGRDGEPLWPLLEKRRKEEREKPETSSKP